MRHVDKRRPGRRVQTSARRRARDVDQAKLLRALEALAGNVEALARRFRVGRKGLVSRLRALGISPRAFYANRDPRGRRPRLRRCPSCGLRLPRKQWAKRKRRRTSRRVSLGLPLGACMPCRRRAWTARRKGTPFPPSD